jgi:hypothetical protein
MGSTKQQLQVENNVNFPNNTIGYITPDLLRQFNSDMIISTVNQDVYNDDSASFSSRINAATNEGQFVTTSSFNAYTQSVSQTIAGLETTASFNSYSSSTAVVISGLETTASYQIDSASFNSRINAVTGSTPAGTVSSSAQIVALGFETTASYQADSASFNTRINSITGSSTNTGSLLVTASAALNVITFTKGDNTTFNVTVASSGSAPAGTVSSSAQITAFGFATTSSVNTLSSSIFQTDATQSTYINQASGSAWGAFQSASAYSASGYQADATQSAAIASLTAQTSSYAKITTNNTYTAGTTQSFDYLIANTASISYLKVIYETSSFIYNSGSNQLGDALSDVQILSGSTHLVGSGDLNGSPLVTANQTASMAVSSSTYSISSSVANTLSASISTQNLQHFVTFTDNSTGNNAIFTDGGIKYNPNQDLLLVTNITSSGYISASAVLVGGLPVATSQSLTNYSSSQATLNNTLSSSIATVSSSVGLLQTFSASQYNTDSSSFNTRINGLSTTGSVNTLSASIYQTDATQSYQITANALTASTALTNYSSSQSTLNNTLSSSIATNSSSIGLLQTFSSSQYIADSSSFNTRINGIIPIVGYATTGSNTFIGTEIVTGSLIITGSVSTLPVSVTISSNTASLDFSKGTIFTLQLVSSSVPTYVTASNIQPGQTANLLVTQAASLSGSLVWASQFKFPSGSSYTGSATISAVDLVSFVTVNTTTIYSAGAKNLI